MGTGIIYVDGDDGLETDALFGRSTDSALSYISSSVNNYINAIGDKASDMALRISNRYQELTSSTMANKIESLRDRINSTWSTNTIKPLHTLSELQQATPIMHKHIMAHPVVRERWNRGAIEGFDGAYTDNQPGAIGGNHYDYRRITNGVAMFNKDRSDVVYHRYIENDVSADDILLSIERMRILETWASIDRIEETGTVQDLTSVWNSVVD